MTVKDFQDQFAEHSTHELHLMELAIYRELERRGELPDVEVDDATINNVVITNEQMKNGTMKTFSAEQFEEEMEQYRKKKK